MSDTPQFCNDDGHHLYWAGAPAPYGEGFTVVFTYAANDNMARELLLKSHDSVEDLSVLKQEHLSWGQIVLAGAHWSIEQGNPAILNTFLNAYKVEGHQPPTPLLIHAAHRGCVEAFDVVRPYFTLAFMGNDGKHDLARAIGQGGCVDTLSRVARHFLPTHFECAMEHASLNGHQHMVNLLATKCSAQNVLNHMIQEDFHPHCYLAVQNVVNQQQSDRLYTVLPVGAKKHATGRKI